jgi:hypothetical protein
MKTVTRRLVIVLAALAAASLLAGPSLASDLYREFSGRIDKINKKKMIVDNRQGDKVSFIQIDTTEVSGEGKSSWKELRKKDWVTVSWKFIDKPRKAYKIVVQQPKLEAGKDL